MKNIIYIYFFVFVTGLVAQTSNTDLFDLANTQYKEGKYEASIANYQKIVAQENVSSALFFNLANAYYKLNKVAQTIYYYEKALLLDPLNEDAANNLAFAKRMTIDRIEELPKTFLQKLEVNYLQKLTYNQWAMFAVVCSFLGAILFLLFYFSANSTKKRVYFITSVLSFFLLISSLFIAYHLSQKASTTKFAIIFATKVSVNNAPTTNADEVFILHEGTKVSVLDAVDDWKKIKLADGKIGWISASNLKELE